MNSQITGILAIVIVLTIKFRAAGITFANVNKTLDFHLPAEIQPIAGFVPNVNIGSFSDHGVALSLSLRHDQIAAADTASPPVPPAEEPVQ